MIFAIKLFEYNNGEISGTLTGIVLLLIFVIILAPGGSK